MTSVVVCAIYKIIAFFVPAELALFRLKTLAVVAGRQAKMLRAVATEVRERREVHQVGYLGEGQAFVIQIVF
jgi:hypothetical protein